MGLTKSEIFTQEQNNLAKMAKALAHPARIAILQHIINTKGCVCGDLVEEIGLAQPTISQHLKELKNVQLIKGDIDGTKVCYCIDTNTMNKFKTQLLGFLNVEENCDDSCC